MTSDLQGGADKLRPERLGRSGPKSEPDNNDGVPKEMLVDNARALVSEHDAESRTVVFNPSFLAFARDPTGVSARTISLSLAS